MYPYQPPVYPAEPGMRERRACLDRQGDLGKRLTGDACQDRGADLQQVQLYWKLGLPAEGAGPGKRHVGPLGHEGGRLDLRGGGMPLHQFPPAPAGRRGLGFRLGNRGLRAERQARAPPRRGVRYVRMTSRSFGVRAERTGVRWGTACMCDGCL